MKIDIASDVIGDTAGPLPLSLPVPPAKPLRCVKTHRAGGGSRKVRR
jgi:hypothetical protein